MSIWLRLRPLLPFAAAIGMAALVSGCVYPYGGYYGYGYGYPYGYYGYGYPSASVNFAYGDGWGHAGWSNHWDH
jgi:hypothetical protein